MAAAVPRLCDEAELARTTAFRQVLVLMCAAGLRMTEDDLRSGLRTMPDDRLLEMPDELADALDWYRVHAPGDIPRIFAAELDQLRRHADAGEPPLTDDDIEAETQAARAIRAA
jgi:hypothetical protein